MKLDRVSIDAPLSAETAATYLDVTVDSLSKIIRDDDTFPVHRIGKGPKAHRRFYRSEIDAWLRNRCSDNTPATSAS